jgi:hypothetical protein
MTIFSKKFDCFFNISDYSNLKIYDKKCTQNIGHCSLSNYCLTQLFINKKKYFSTTSTCLTLGKKNA